METWTIYDHPTDHPTGFIARRFDNGTPTSGIITGTLDNIRLVFESR